MKHCFPLHESTYVAFNIKKYLYQYQRFWPCVTWYLLETKFQGGQGAHFLFITFLFPFLYLLKDAVGYDYCKTKVKLVHVTGSSKQKSVWLLEYIKFKFA